jgi:hypothetical protein
MKLISIGAFMLVLACTVSLVAGGQSRHLIEQTWSRASDVLPESTMNRLSELTPGSSERVVLLMPPALREKLGSKLWNAVEVMIFRVLLVWHLAPALLIACLIGLAEGHWARASQRRLVQIHSPMRFTLALGGLAMIPLLVLLWVTAPLIVPINALVSCTFILAVLSLRNLIIHAPTQF